MKYISPRQFGDLYLILEKIDVAYADEAHKRPCQYCGGPLDDLDQRLALFCNF